MNKPTAFVACALLAAVPVAFAQSEGPVAALPAGPTADEVSNYATAQVRYRSAQASGNDDIAMHALSTFSQIPQEILLRQDPGLYNARAACERHRAIGPGGTFEPQFRGACTDIEWRYNEEAVAIRGDLAARTAGADRAVIAQAAPAPSR